MSGLAGKIQAAIDRTEQLAKAALADGYSLTVVGDRGQDYYLTGYCSPLDALRRCAAEREIVSHFHALTTRYRQLKSPAVLDEKAFSELRTLEARIADFAAVILPALATGYEIQS